MPPRWPLQQPYQDLIRLRHIAETLMRHGLGFIIERWGLTSLLPLRRGRSLATEQAAERFSPAVRVRRALEELGPTYIKLGQLLSTRPDLLPADVITELSKLLDDVPPFPTDVAIRRIEMELGRPLDELFAQFEPTPIAAASIGQVHRAQLHSGERVVVKVRRPGIEQTIESDLALLLRQAKFLEAHSSFLREYQIVDILEEFGQSLRDELNYVREGNNADRLRRALERKKQVQIPIIHWDMTTQRVIVMQDIAGTKLNELLAAGGEGHDLPAIAKMIADAYLEQVFIAGFFHADPHPANILIQDGGMGLVDFGLVGFLSTTVKESLGDLFVALMTQDVVRVGDLILRLGAASVSVNRQSLQKDIQRLLQRYYGLPLEHIMLDQSLEEVMQVAFRHHIRLPSDLALLARTLIILEGITRQLDPQFNLVQFARPFMSRMIGERLSLHHLRDEATSLLREYSELTRALPRYSMDLMQRLQQGEATVRIEVNELERLMHRADKVGNRLAFSVVTAALIIGSAFLIQAGAESSVWQLPIVGWAIPIARLVFVIAGILGVWLLFSIVRARGL